jgi:hypothetical protein
LISVRTFQPRPSPQEAVPCSNEALRQDLQRVRNAWEDAQSSRDRNAIYAYLSAVYGLVAWWTAEGRVCLAPDRAATYAIRQRLLRNHSSQVPQDRRARAHQRAPHQDRDGVGLSRRPDLGRNRRPSQCRGKCARFARLTRGAATRHNRGIIPSPTETISSLPPQPPKIPAARASLDATVACEPRKDDQSIRKTTRSSKDSVRYPG